MSDNIHVVIRVRPIDRSENISEQKVWSYDENSINQLSSTNEGKSQVVSTYTFDRVYGEDSHTSELYCGTASPIIKSVLDGINTTVFAYGQTSSGKTHTMRGDEISPGIIPLSINEIFDYIEKNTELEFCVRVSYMEIYNENIQDLLQPNNVNLKIHEDIDKGVFVGNLREEIVTKPSHALDYLVKGDYNRKIGRTNMNEYSSRSHSIFRLVIESRCKLFNHGVESISEVEFERGDENDLRGCDSRGVKISFLNLVDLAGSERAYATGAEGIRLKEGAHINKSLLTLERVISKLSSPNTFKTSQLHIPFRDSRLTRILQSSLGGNSRTLIICTITPAAIYQEESHSTLKFANSAKNIQNKPQVNQYFDDKTLLKQYRSKIYSLEQQIENLKKLNFTNSGSCTPKLCSSKINVDSIEDPVPVYGSKKTSVDVVQKRFKRRRSCSLPLTGNKKFSDHGSSDIQCAKWDNDDDDVLCNTKFSNDDYSSYESLESLLRERLQLRSKIVILESQIEKLKVCFSTPQKEIATGGLLNEDELPINKYQDTPTVADVESISGFSFAGMLDGDVQDGSESSGGQQIESGKGYNCASVSRESLEEENARLKKMLEDSNQTQQQLVEEHMVEELSMQEKIDQLQRELEKYKNSNPNESPISGVDEAISCQVTSNTMSTDTANVEENIARLDEQKLEFLASKARFQSELELQRNAMSAERSECERYCNQMAAKIDAERNELEAQRVELDVAKIEFEERLSRLLESIDCSDGLLELADCSDGLSEEQSPMDALLQKLDKILTGVQQRLQNDNARSSKELISEERIEDSLTAKSEGIREAIEDDIEARAEEAREAERLEAIEAVHGKLRQVESELDASRRINDKLYDELQSVTQESESLYGQLQSVTQENESLYGQLQEYVEEIGQLSLQSAQAKMRQAECEKLQDECEQWQARVLDLEGDLSVVTTELERCEVRLEEAGATKSKLEGMILRVCESFGERIALCESCAARTESVLEGGVQVCDALEQLLSTMESQMSEQRESLLEDSRRQCVSLRQQCAEQYECDIAVLKQSHEEDRLSWQRDLDKATSLADELKRQLYDLQLSSMSEAQEAQKLYAELGELELKRVKAELGIVQRTLDEYNEAIDECRAYFSIPDSGVGAIRMVALKSDELKATMNSKFDELLARETGQLLEQRAVLEQKNNVLNEELVEALLREEQIKVMLEEAQNKLDAAKKLDCESYGHGDEEQMSAAMREEYSASRLSEAMRYARPLWWCDQDEDSTAAEEHRLVSRVKLSFVHLELLQRQLYDVRDAQLLTTAEEARELVNVETAVSLSDSRRASESEEHWTAKVSELSDRVQQLEFERDEVLDDLKAINEKNKQLENYWNLDISNYEKQLGEYRCKLQDLLSHYREKKSKLRDTEMAYEKLKNNVCTRFNKHQRGNENFLLDGSEASDNKFSNKVLSDDKENQIYIVSDNAVR